MAVWQLDLMLAPASLKGAGTNHPLSRSPICSKDDGVNYWPDRSRAWSQRDIGIAELHRVVAKVLSVAPSPHGEIIFGDDFDVRLRANAKGDRVWGAILRISLLSCFPPTPGLTIGDLDRQVDRGFQVLAHLCSTMNLVALWPDTMEEFEPSNAFLFLERARFTKAWRFCQEYCERVR